MSEGRGAIIGSNGAYDNMGDRMRDGNVEWTRLDVQSPPCLETLGKGAYEELPGTILKEAP